MLKSVILNWYKPYFFLKGDIDAEKNEIYTIYIPNNTLSIVYALNIM